MRHAYGAVVGRDQARYHIEQSGLARAVAADEADQAGDASRRNSEIDATQDIEAIPKPRVSGPLAASVQQPVEQLDAACAAERDQDRLH